MLMLHSIIPVVSNWNRFLWWLYIAIYECYPEIWHASRFYLGTSTVNSIYRSHGAICRLHGDGYQLYADDTHIYITFRINNPETSMQHPWRLRPASPSPGLKDRLKWMMIKQSTYSWYLPTTLAKSPYNWFGLEKLFRHGILLVWLMTC